MSSGHHVGNLQLVSPGSHARLRLIQPLDKLGELGQALKDSPPGYDLAAHAASLEDEDDNNNPFDVDLD